MNNGSARGMPIKVGAARVDITPEPGWWLGGNATLYRPAEEFLDPLHARALVLKGCNMQVCILSLDIVAVSNVWTERIRRRAAERFGLEPSAIMIHATQNHAAPYIGDLFYSEECREIPEAYPWIRGSDNRYNEFATERILEAVGKAVDSQVPVSCNAGGRADGRVAFNRRLLMRDGTVRVSVPRGNDWNNVLQVEGPTDPEVGVLALADQSSRTVATLLHHTCHPCHGLSVKGIVTAGWPGEWSRQMESFTSASSINMVINGCCGNIHHKNRLDPTQVEDARRIGAMLTETAGAVFSELKPETLHALDYRNEKVPIPWTKYSAGEIDWARQFLRDHPEPLWDKPDKTSIDWDWVYAVAMLEKVREIERSPCYNYEVQAFRIGDAGLVALTGEPFVEGQLEIKRRSPAKRTFIAHMCNGSVGYIPHREGYHRKGYYAGSAGRLIRRGANWYWLVPEALEMIVKKSIDLLEELFCHERAKSPV